MFAKCGKRSQRSRRLGGETGSTAEALRARRVGRDGARPYRETLLTPKQTIFRILDSEAAKRPEL